VNTTTETTTTEEIPLWFSQGEPETHSYSMVMQHPDTEEISCACDLIEMTREEYMALRLHLAAMRGYTIGDFRARIAELEVEGHTRPGDLQQAACHLETARAVYRVCPDLVVHDSAELAEYIEERADPEFEGEKTAAELASE
jgi:hypothetical protein